MHGKVAPKTNISKKQYRHIVNDIEHDPLIRRSTLVAACMAAVICVLLGALIWFSKTNPGNLVQASGVVTGISTGKTDALGTQTTFVTFDFSTSSGEKKSVRQPAISGVKYETGHSIKIGYHPKNTNYARLLNDNRPPEISLWLWAAPFLIMIWFIFVALFRHHARQEEIWNAAEAADAED